MASVKEEKFGVKEEKSAVKDESMVEEPRPDYDILASRVTPISRPLASRKLTKKLYKVVKKGSKVKSVRRGVKEVVKAIRKKEVGLVVIAGDVTPIDVISHIPVFCEENKLPYVFVPSKLDLGAASITKRPTSIVMVKPHDDIKEHYDDCYGLVKLLPLPI